MNTPAKCFFVYQPHTKDFLRIDFAMCPHDRPFPPSNKHQRKLTQSDDTSFAQDLGTMEFQPITIKPTL